MAGQGAGVSRPWTLRGEVVCYPAFALWLFFLYVILCTTESSDKSNIVNFRLDKSDKVKQSFLTFFIKSLILLGVGNGKGQGRHVPFTKTV